MCKSWENSKRKKFLDEAVKNAGLKKSNNKNYNDYEKSAYPEAGKVTSDFWFMNIVDQKSKEKCINALKKVLPESVSVFDYSISKIAFVFNDLYENKTEVEKTVVGLWESGIHTMTKIAKELGITVSDVKKKLIEAGLK